MPPNKEALAGSKRETAAHSAKSGCIRGGSRFHLVNAAGIQCGKEIARFFGFKVWIAGFDTKKKTIATGKSELGDVEHRVVRHRQTIEREKADHRGQSGGENR